MVCCTFNNLPTLPSTVANTCVRACACACVCARAHAHVCEMRPQMHKWVYICTHSHSHGRWNQEECKHRSPHGCDCACRQTHLPGRCRSRTRAFARAGRGCWPGKSWLARHRPPAMHCAWRLAICAMICAARAPRAKSAPSAGLLPVSRASMRMLGTCVIALRRGAHGRENAATQGSGRGHGSSHIQAGSKVFVELCRGSRIGT